MGFRFRLASFLVLSLVTVQILTAGLVYSVTRTQLLREGERQLGSASLAFGRQLDDMSQRVAASVEVLSLDFALRSAIAQRDQATLRSALANHGRRIGAMRMQLVGLDGRVEADTQSAAGGQFPYGDLLERSFDGPASAVVAWNGRAYWVVAVPVFAPDLVGAIAAMLPVDAALLARMQAQSALPRTIELVAADGPGWIELARGSGGAAPLAASLTKGGAPLPVHPTLVRAGGREYLAQAVWLKRSRASPPIVAVLAYSVDEALQPYRSVGLAWALLLSLGLAIGVIGAFLIARRVSQPVEQLAAAARRIQAGDDAMAPEIARSDEIGALASAFAGMAGAIREREDRILHQAGHDQVTGLPNRVAAEAEIGRECRADAAAPSALLMVGLRRMPDIVKTLGHAVSDRLMRVAGERLRQVGGCDHVARATDTEFSVLLPGRGRHEAIACAYRIIDALSAPYQEGDLNLDLAPAVGIALAPEHGAQAADLLRRAGVGFIAALDTEDAVVVYDPATDPHRPERLALMGELRQALERDELQLHYQPRLHLASNTIDGAEALVRWHHATLGDVPPEAFIALAEETGNIRRLTRWALATGISQAQRWRDAPHALRVAINLSARDLDDDGLPRRVAELLALHALAPERILLEVTESAVMARPDAALRILHRLADLGIDLSIDDFGVGQSSFAYLRQLPVRELKIDRLFVRRISGVAADRTIVRAIVELGHQLGLRVTAEGVEDADALAFLAGIGCDHAQGFFIARPMPVADLDRMLARRAGAAARPVA